MYEPYVLTLTWTQLHKSCHLYFSCSRFITTSLEPSPPPAPMPAIIVGLKHVKATTAIIIIITIIIMANPRPPLPDPLQAIIMANPRTPFLTPPS